MFLRGKNQREKKLEKVGELGWPDEILECI